MWSKAIHKHHLSQTTFLLSHRDGGPNRNCKHLAKYQEECKVHREEDIGRIWKVVWVSNDWYNDSVSDEQLDDDIDEWHGEDKYLEGTPAKNFQPIYEDCLDLLPWALLTLVVLVVFKCLLFIFFRKELIIFIAKCFVLLHFLLNVFFGDFNESILQWIQFNISLHFWDVAFNFSK